MIYLDNCATTPLDPSVADVIARVSCECFGNPSSIHTADRCAAKVLADAREVIAGSIHARPDEIVLTSSGSEANNFVVSGVVRHFSTTGKVHVITTMVEHASVEARLRFEQRHLGPTLDVTFLPVNSNGLLDMQELARAIRPDTRLLSILHCNNETGVIQDLEALASLKLRNPSVLLHLDIVQSYMKQEFDVRTLPVDFLTVSAHKIYGPKGIGFVYVRDGIDAEPFVVGGAQEKFRRAGTENVPAAAGFARAVEKMPPHRELTARYARLERVFLSVLEQERIGHVLHGPQDHKFRMPGIFNISFDGVKNKEDLQIALDLEGVLLSSTSACHSGVVTESHVLKAMGVGFDAMCGSVRVCFNKFHDENDMRTAGRIVAKVARRVAQI